MATVKTKAELLAQFGQNTTGQIGYDDCQDLIVTALPGEQTEVEPAVSDEIVIADSDGTIKKVTAGDIANLATAAGSSGQVQFNEDGVRSGSSNLTFDGTTLTAAAVHVDNVSVDGNSISVTEEDGDLNLSPNGEGHVVIGEAVPEATHSIAFAGVPFAVAGDAQTAQYVLQATTTDETSTIMSIDGSGVGSLVTMPENCTCVVEAHVVGRRIDAAGESAGYVVRSVADRYASVNTGGSVVVGSPTTTAIAEDQSAWDAGLAVIGNDIAPFITVTGEAGKTIRWVANYTITIVAGAVT